MIKCRIVLGHRNNVVDYKIINSTPPPNPFQVFSLLLLAMPVMIERSRQGNHDHLTQFRNNIPGGPKLNLHHLQRQCFCYPTILRNFSHTGQHQHLKQSKMTLSQSLFLPTIDYHEYVRLEGLLVIDIGLRCTEVLQSRS